VFNASDTAYRLLPTYLRSSHARLAALGLDSAWIARQLSADSQTVSIIDSIVYAPIRREVRRTQQRTAREERAREDAENCIRQGGERLYTTGLVGKADSLIAACYARYGVRP
jgi:hypothetical protein